MYSNKLKFDKDEDTFDPNTDDQGIIRCICGFDEDDGFTIQCENCLVWQHAVCVNINQDNVPDEYLCEECNPRKLDVKAASEYQRQRLDNEQKAANDSKKKTKPIKYKRSQITSDSSNSALVDKRNRKNLPRSKSYHQK
ncbi:hypothetical protein BB560_005199, partial [Smittium megazygosporum]